jgi:hypothetical protein
VAALVTVMPASYAQKATQQSAAEVLKKANAAASEVEQLRQNLRSPDQSVRVATFQAMIESNNPSLVEIAISEGFASTDEAMKTMAFRAAAADTERVIFEPIGLPAGQVYRNYDTQANGLNFALQNYDWRSGTFCSRRDPNGVCQTRPPTGQFSGRTFTFKTDFCQGQLQNVDGTWEFEGQIICNPGYNDSMSGKFRLKLR